MAVGVVLCEIAIFLLTLGTNMQRYGLSVVPERGCCGRKTLGCISLSTLVWLSGWAVYIFGNCVFLIAVSLAPATLCSALLATVVIWNALISRMLLGERSMPCDYHGGGGLQIRTPMTTALNDASLPPKRHISDSNSFPISLLSPPL